MSKYELMKKIALYAILTACFFTATPVFASTYNVDCTYFDTYDAGATCSSGVITFLGSGGDAYHSSQTGGVFTTGTWYISFTATPVTGTGNWCLRGNCSFPQSFSTSITDQPYTADATDWFYIEDSHSYTGTISNICISDSPGNCVSPTPPSETWPFSPFGTATTTYQVVDNPTQDFANIIIIFLAGMWFSVYLFSKKK